MMFNTLYTLGNSVAVSSDDDKVFAHAAVNGKKAALVISNVNNEEVDVNIDLKNFPTDEVQIFRIDEENRYTLTGEVFADGKLRIPENSCVEIKLWNLAD
jgi:hypothetical protein